jgi:oxygen-independent coproporphyrinogen-3 oxidase
MADKYLLADALLESAGLHNYEISNWSLPGFECIHNMAYWQSRNWWGIGPGAHSHVGGFRWWNHAAPATWERALLSGAGPAAGSEQLTVQERREEQIMLALRTSSGLDLRQHPDITANQLDAIDQHLCSITDAGALVLTPPGRLLADVVIRELFPQIAP